jgi:hypothetical protein
MTAANEIEIIQGQSSMAMNEVLTITYADVPGFPVGTVVDHILITVTDAAVPPVNPTLTQSVPDGTATVTFLNIAAGNYSFSIAGRDVSGNVLGTPVTGTFTVTTPVTISLSLPVSATAAQA